MVKLAHRPLHTATVASIGRDALARGATLHSAAGNIRWNVAGNCERPVERVVTGVPYERWGVRKRNPYDGQVYVEAFDIDMAKREKEDGPQGVRISLTARCRVCPDCLRSRARDWAFRCISEIRASHRTWLGTLTLRPEAHTFFLAKTRVRLDRGGTDLESLSPEDRFAETERELSREVRLMFKRMRKAGHQFRQIVVAEKHEGGGVNHGFAHYHLLLHEVGEPIRKAYLGGDKDKDIVSVWPHGFSAWKLVPPDEPSKRTAWYVCKYLHKSALIRVRASTRYGISYKDIPSQLNEVSFEQSEKRVIDPQRGEFCNSLSRSWRDGVLKPSPTVTELEERDDKLWPIPF